MVQDQNPQSDLTVGCSNITQLQFSNPGTQPKARQIKRRPSYADLSKYDRPLEATEIDTNELNSDKYSISSRKYSQQHIEMENHPAGPYDFLDSLNKSFLPGLGLGILVTTVVVLIWGATRLRQNVNSSRSSSPATTCYAASEHIARIADSENGARYLKLQATTSL